MDDKSPKLSDLVSLDNFKKLCGTLPVISQQMREAPGIVRSFSKEKAAKLLGKGLRWSTIYELPFSEQVALLICAIGREEKLHQIAQSENPVEATFNLFENDDLEDWNGGAGGAFTEQNILGLITSLHRNILSIMLFHRTIDTMVEDVRKGNDESFFDVVRLDRSIVACPTFADRIARAELENDKTFFTHLRSALKGPTKKHWESYKDLRYAFYALRGVGLDSLSDAELENLLVHQLKLYPNTPSARKNLRKQYTQSKKIGKMSTT